MAAVCECVRHSNDACHIFNVLFRIYFFCFAFPTTAHVFDAPLGFEVDNLPICREAAVAAAASSETILKLFCHSALGSILADVATSTTKATSFKNFYAHCSGFGVA